jgi:hypothetical protein
MNRVIKFRYIFKHNKTNELDIHIFTLDGIQKHNIYDTHRNTTYKGHEDSVLDWEIIARNQFTGLKDKGIMIRDIGKIFDEHYFRVTVGTEEMNQIFLNTVKKIVHG